MKLQELVVGCATLQPCNLYHLPVNTAAVVTQQCKTYSCYSLLIFIFYIYCIHSTTTTALVNEYKQQYECFMTSTTVSQFRKLFPVSATSSKQLIEKFPIRLKLENYWGQNTLADLSKLVSLFGVSGDRLHLSKVEEGCIAVIWLCSTSVLKEVETAIAEANDSLRARGVLQVFIGESECFHSNSGNALFVISIFKITI